MKRKNEENVEDNPWLKSLRKSITNYVESGTEHKDESSQQKSIEKIKTMDNLHARMATFTTVKWHGKPKELSPLKCAQYGWICLDADFLQCNECKKSLCVKIPPLSEISLYVYNSCIRNCLRQLLESHDIVCSWRFAEASDTLFAYDISKRYEELVKSDIKVPLVEVTELEITEEQLSLFHVENRTILLMSIFGWTIRDLNSEIFFCPVCMRRLNVKVFSDEMPINPLKEHHYWCPIAEKSQPLWKEMLMKQTETKEVHKSFAGKLAVIKTTLLDALANKPV